MIITPQKAIELGILITNDKGTPSPNGYDLTIEKVTEIQGGIITTKESKINPYKEVETDIFEELETEGWSLGIGVYSLTFEQGIKLDLTHCANIVHRSSILRSGCIITSGVFDSGFECKNIGATLFVFIPILIEKGARIAQIVINETYEAEQKYEGQFQSTKDLK